MDDQERWVGVTTANGLPSSALRIWMKDGPAVNDPDPADRTYSWREALSGWWSDDPVFAVDEALHCLPWRVHALLFSWWLCDLVDLRLGMTWRELLRDRKTRTPQWRDALRHWGK